MWFGFEREPGGPVEFGDPVARVAGTLVAVATTENFLPGLAVGSGGTVVRFGAGGDAEVLSLGSFDLHDVSVMLARYSDHPGPHPVAWAVGDAGEAWVADGEQAPWTKVESEAFGKLDLLAVEQSEARLAWIGAEAGALLVQDESDFTRVELGTSEDIIGLDASPHSMAVLDVAGNVYVVALRADRETGIRAVEHWGNAIDGTLSAWDPVHDGDEPLELAGGFAIVHQGQDGCLGQIERVCVGMTRGRVACRRRAYVLECDDWRSDGSTPPVHRTSAGCR